MSTNWDEVEKALLPIKNHKDLCRRLQGSFAYPFVREIFNFSMPDLVDYTQRLLGGDSRGRYSEYSSRLVGIMTMLDQASVCDMLDLVTRVETREQFEAFAEQSGVAAPDTAAVLKYLVYWVIPMEKPLAGLVREDPETSEVVRVLHGLGIRTNLQMLQRGRTAAGRQALANASELPEEILLDLTNRADFSRMPWASKATISNIMSAGYRSIAELAGANPQQLYADFFRYGQTIGKNLKLGNEIESSYRIAKIVPPLLKTNED